MKQWRRRRNRCWWSSLTLSPRPKSLFKFSHIQPSSLRIKRSQSLHFRNFLSPESLGSSPSSCSFFLAHDRVTQLVEIWTHEGIGSRIPVSVSPSPVNHAYRIPNVDHQKAPLTPPDIGASPSNPSTGSTAVPISSSLSSSALPPSPTGDATPPPVRLEDSPETSSMSGGRWWHQQTHLQHFQFCLVVDLTWARGKPSPPSTHAREVRRREVRSKPCSGYRTIGRDLLGKMTHNGSGRLK